MTKKEMFMQKYGKILIPLVTPFKENEEVDYAAYAELVDYLIKNDMCDTLVVTGTTGEASLLTFDERVKLIETAIAASKGRKPIIAGTGCASTKETIALTLAAEKQGVELCMVVAPFYNKPDQAGLYTHYKRVAESTKCKILLYNIPIFVGVNLDAETVGRLAAIENIVGIKDEAGINPTQLSDYYLATKDVNPDFVLFNGDDIMLLATIVQGAVGIVSGGSHIFGKDIRAIFDAYQNGQYQRGYELFLPLYKFCKSCGQNGRVLPNPILRPAIEMVTGVKIGKARGPLSPITEIERKVVVEALTEAGKL